MRSLLCTILLFFSSLSVLYGQAGLHINAGTHLVCQGSVHVVISGDLINNGTFSPANETVYLSGSIKQYIGGSGDNTFYGIELNNAAGAELSSDVIVTNELNLSNGLLDLANSNLTLGTAITSVSGTPSASNMVVTSGTGELRKRFTGTPVSDDSDAFTFPVGTNGGTAEYTPVIMNFLSATFGPQAYVSVITDDVKNPYLSETVTTYLDRNWVVEPNDITGFNYEIKLYYSDNDVVAGAMTEGDLVPVKYSSGSWYEPEGLLTDFPDAIEQGSSFVYTGPNYMVWGGLTSFSFFGGAGGSNNPLPVEFLSLNAECEPEAVVLTWSTASEHNSAYFDLEKSENGEDWEIIHTEQAAGNSTSQLDYQFVDPHRYVNTVYYRLNQFDIDGESEYFGPVEVSCQENGRLMTFPNPSTGSFNLLINDHRFVGDVNMKVVDATGKIVGDKELSVLAGMNVFPWYDSVLEEGMYFIVLTTDSNSATLRHVVSQ